MKDPSGYIDSDSVSSLNEEKMKIVVKYAKEMKNVVSISENLIEVVKSPQEKYASYLMQGTMRGVAFVINNIEFENNFQEKRNGAGVDAENLKELFTQMGFEWIYWENLKRKDIRDKLQEFTSENNEMLSKVDSCFVIVMSHGGQGNVPEDTHIITHDNHKYKASDIISRFSNSSCIPLQGKPKVIIFQACRGELQDLAIKEQHESNIKCQTNTVESDNAPTDHSYSERTISSMSDMFICYTTSPGYRSFRDPSKGAWFIQYFCEIFMNHAYNTDVRDLFGMIADKVSGQRTIEYALQVPYYVNVKFRPCFLYPLLKTMDEELETETKTIPEELLDIVNDLRYKSETKKIVKELKKLF